MISSERVEEIFFDSMFKDEEIVNGEPTTEPVKVIGIVRNCGFHAERLNSHKQEVKEFLSQFPDDFYKSKGGGHTFLNFCNLKDDTQWTDLHIRMEQLMQLGIGLGLIEYCAPREVWKVLPGGMPYITII
jgi:hypothetical protein